MPKTFQTVAIEKIVINAGTQTREKLDQDVIAEYAEAMKNGENFPPLYVFFDGSQYYLADGFHRYSARKLLGDKKVDCDVEPGTLQEAQLESYSVNRGHGVRRSNATKRNAVLGALNNPLSKNWTDYAIAKHCGVSSPFVAAVRSPEKKAKQEDNRQKSESKKASERQAEKPQNSNPITTPKSNTDTESSSDTTSEHDDSMPTMEELLDDLQTDNERLTAQITALSQDDLAAETLKWRKAYENATREHSAAMDRAHASVKREKWAMDQLRRIGRAVGCDDPRKIALAVEKAVGK